MSLSPMQQFQAILFEQVLARLWKTVPSTGQSVSGSEIYRSLANAAVARQMVAGGLSFGQTLEAAMKQDGQSK